MVRGCWWYYFSKFTEFMDTVCPNFFFVFNTSPNKLIFADIFRFTEKKRSHIHAARHSSRGHAYVCLVRSQIHPGRSLYLLRISQHVRPHHNVHVLLLCRLGTSIPEVFMVEKVSDDGADGKFRNLVGIFCWNCIEECIGTKFW